MGVSIQEIQTAIAIIKDVFTALATITAAVIAILGLQTWKKQLKGKTEYDLASRLLRAIYKVRNSFIEARNPSPDYDEIIQAAKEAKIEDYPNLTSESFVRREQARYNIRLKKVRDAFVELDSISLEAEALWGQVVIENLRDLNQCAAKLNLNIQHYLRSLSESSTEYDRNAEREIETIIFDWPDNPNDNPFTNEINEAIKRVEIFLKPRLKLKI